MARDAGGRGRSRREGASTARRASAAALASMTMIHVMHARASPAAPMTIDEFSERVLMTDEPAIVNFHSPTCPHCRALAPEWALLREEFSERKRSVVVADVDCSTSRDVCEWQKVRAYPTIKFYDDVNGESGEEYRRGATYDALASFVEHFLER